MNQREIEQAAKQHEAALRALDRALRNAQQQRSKGGDKGFNVTLGQRSALARGHK